MQQAVSIILSCIATAIVSGFIAMLHSLWTKQKAMMDGMLALMHDRIYGIYADCSRKGYATIEDIENMEYLYEPYHDLGGNGTGTELLKRVKSMPERPTDKEKTA